MMKEKIKIMSRFYGILMSASLLIFALCLIVGCLSIYYGEGEYTREIVAETFRSLPFVAVVLALSVLMGVFVTPSVVPFSFPKSALLEAMYKKYDVEASDESLKAAVYMLSSGRKKLKIASRCISAVCLLAFAVYALLPSNYGQDINASVIRCMLVLLPCAVISFAAHLVIGHFTDKIAEAEMSALKKCARRTKPLSDTQVSNYAVLKTVITVLAVVLLVCGFLSGGTEDVLTKAINICTECIGLG